ncbi:MAG: YajQ family cyclic di-GMP-binding protein [Myxococcaceae bacterium]|nr:YajQ family cyclic di-GMP-binding protein [Myxococcaceae bacterium]
MPSFDVVSKVDLQEVDNAVNNAKKEILTRYDFRGSNTELTLGDDKASLTIKTNDEVKLNAAYDVFLQKAVKRGLSARSIDRGPIEKVGMGMVKQTITIKQGIPTEKAKELVKVVKESKLKVQASIQGDQLRVTGKSKDDLQQAIALLRAQQDKIQLDLQFNNFRD